MLRRLDQDPRENSTTDPSPSPASRRRPRKRRLRYFLAVLLIGLSGAGGFVTLRIIDPFVVSEVRKVAFELLQRSAPRPYIETPLRIVDINERSLSELGQWPWPRDKLAEMVDRLHAAGAAAVVFDFLFIEPDRVRTAPDQAGSPLKFGFSPNGNEASISINDQIFADALKRGNVVLGFGTSSERTSLPPVKSGFAYTGDDPAPFVTRLNGGASVLPILAEAAAGIGSVSLRSDNTGSTVQVVQLVWSDGEKLYPSLISEALRVAQGAKTYVIHAGAERHGVESFRIGAFEVPTGPNGELLIYYTKPRPERYIGAVDLFDDAKLSALAGEIAGKIILIGTSATGLFDVHKTALGDTVPGVEMHAQAIEQIVNGQFLLRKEWTRNVEILAIVIACLSVWFVTIFGGVRIALVFGAAISALVACGTWYAFKNLGVLVDFSFPLGGGLAMWFFATAFRYAITDREKRGIRSAFGRYVHPSVLKQIEENYSKVELGGENCELTVMFTDVRNFTSLSERLQPQEVVAFLNRLLGSQCDRITDHGGVIDKMIGDAVMAFWNAPLRQKDHARRACAAALSLRHAMREMKETKGFGLPKAVESATDIAIGVGVNTGLACVGNIGSEQRFNYSAIGDAVNIAARTESACKELAFDLVICGATAEQVPEFAFLDAGSLQVKGKTERVQMMALIGDENVKNSPQFSKLSRRFDELIAALTRGDKAELDRAMRDCKELAKPFDAPLGAFLDRIRERPMDFEARVLEEA